jgi:DNA topoisomerase-1
MAVAVYFLDKLALRAGHEKDEDEADTVGCCTLKVWRGRVMWIRVCVVVCRDA